MPIGEKREPGSVDDGQEQQKEEMGLETYDTNQLKVMLQSCENGLGILKKYGKNALSPLADYLGREKERVENELAKREQVEKQS